MLRIRPHSRMVRTDKRKGRAPSIEPSRPAISARSQLRPGTPTALGRGALPLLPSGPGGVRHFPSRGAQPSTPSRTSHSTRAALERGFNPAVADCGLQGTATSPSSTATCWLIADKGPSASLAPSAARSTYREYASRAALRRRLAAGPFSTISPSLERHMASSCPTDDSDSAIRNAGWRRGWDSNPRYSCPYTAFPVPHLRPLGHPSLTRHLRKLAEGRGFEPPRDSRPYPISSRTPSTGLGHPSANVDRVESEGQVYPVPLTGVPANPDGHRTGPCLLVERSQCR